MIELGKGVKAPYSGVLMSEGDVENYLLLIDKYELLKRGFEKYEADK